MKDDKWKAGTWLNDRFSKAYKKHNQEALSSISYIRRRLALVDAMESRLRSIIAVHRDMGTYPINLLGAHVEAAANLLGLAPAPVPKPVSEFPYSPGHLPDPLPRAAPAAPPSDVEFSQAELEELAEQMFLADETNDPPRQWSILSDPTRDHWRSRAADVLRNEHRARDRYEDTGPDLRWEDLPKEVQEGWIVQERNAFR